MECDNGFCEYNYDGYCNADQEIYEECEDNFWTADTHYDRDLEEEED